MKQRQECSDKQAHRLRQLWLVLTWISIALAVLGALLPGLPTTVFVLTAAWSASLCSPRLRHWLVQHPQFGERLRNWEQGGVIDRNSKWTASVGMLSSMAIVLLSVHQPLLLATIIATIITGAVVVWSRPERLPASNCPLIKRLGNETSHRAN
ncbi:YbaN family protein [Pseudomonas sp. OTU5201]|uniref:YbaN family protein n=1 Tax=Pseudomonas sp. OTU5201 TaxID=3043850 RepID=UPI00313D41B9